MKDFTITPTRRSFLKGGAMAVGAGALSASPLSKAWAAFPERNISILIPTGEGGGADRDARMFATVWRKYLNNANFEYSYYPGAAGQVGYEFYAAKSEPDCYNLLFGNLGPEIIMQAMQNPKAKQGKDFIYFAEITDETMCIFVGKNSKITTIQQLVDEAKKRVVTVATSRLPHPASIGVLALGEATGAKFQLVPFGGGNPSAMAAITGEVDCCTLPITNAIQLDKEVLILTVFAKKNPFGEMADNAPPVNDVFGTKIPALSSRRGFAIHVKAIEAYPDRFKVLEETVKKAALDPEYADLVEKAGMPRSFVSYGGREETVAFADEMLALAEKYKPLLAAKKK
jgi:tripartite-type tricarboxylate transporter receptor subunit TctC